MSRNDDHPETDSEPPELENKISDDAEGSAEGVAADSPEDAKPDPDDVRLIKSLWWTIPPLLAALFFQFVGTFWAPNEARKIFCPLLVCSHKFSAEEIQEIRETYMYGIQDKLHLMYLK